MRFAEKLSFIVLCGLPFVAIALAAARPLHELPGHDVIGGLVFAAALACAWRLAGGTSTRHRSAPGTLGLSGVLLLAPWALIALLWVGIGAPFQASVVENQHRFVLLVINAALIGAGFMVLRDALHARREHFYSSALFAAAVPASGLYLACLSITLAQATMAAQGERTPVPALISHLFDVLEFFACVLTYVCTAFAATSMNRAGLLSKTAMRVLLVLCGVILVLLVLRGIEYPDISGQTAPWYTQPGVIVRIPAIPWLMPGVLGAILLRAAGSAPEERGAAGISDDSKT